MLYLVPPNGVLNWMLLYTEILLGSGCMQFFLHPGNFDGYISAPLRSIVHPVLNQSDLRVNLEVTVLVAVSFYGLLWLLIPS
jgi:hypothetical protein